jgi:hypothetical protein
MGSRVNPACIDSLLAQRCKVYLWHLLSDQERALKLTPMIGGGHTVGSASLNLLAAMGYQHFDLYGYDSCWSMDGQHHASPQEWAVEPPKLIDIGGTNYLASPWMIGQVEQMLSQVFNNLVDYTVKVHGGGMLAAALEQNTLDIYYDLDAAPGSFDFIYSLFNAVGYAKGREYSQIRLQFRNNGLAQKPQDPIALSHEHKTRMLNNVVRPLVQMFGIAEVEQVKDDALHFHYSPRRSLEYYRSSRFIPTFAANREARQWAHDRYGYGPVTITLREAEHWPQRNSNLDEWLKFAKHIEKKHRVVFVRDTNFADTYFDQFESCPGASVDLHKRLALYRRSKMNFFVMNGPASLAFMTKDVPYAVFFKHAPGYPCYDPDWLQQFIGIDPYGQMPWANLKNQRLVYKDDQVAEIIRVYEELLG